MTTRSELVEARQETAAALRRATRTRNNVLTQFRESRAAVEQQQRRIASLRERLNDDTLTANAKRIIREKLVSARAAAETYGRQADKWQERLDTRTDAVRDARAAQREATGAIETYDDYRTRAQLRLPWLPPKLATLFAQHWVEYGDYKDALGALRQSEEYARYFPGIRRENGTLRMSETEYLGVVAAYEDALDDFGINNKWLRSRIPELIEGEVSGTEFRERIAAMDQRILQQGDNLKRIYAEFYGIEGMTTKALLAAAIDPTLRQSLLNKQITVAQIAGQAADAGFADIMVGGRDIDKKLASRLARQGFDQAAARDLFQSAQSVLPTLSAASRRQRAGTFGIMQFVEAEAFANPAGQSQIQRILAGERSAFSEQALFDPNQTGGLSGLLSR